MDKILAHRLAAACDAGDLPTVCSLVSAGASVNDGGESDAWSTPTPPLLTALRSYRHDVVVTLLALGAEPDTPSILYHAASWGLPDTLQVR